MEWKEQAMLMGDHNKSVCMQAMVAKTCDDLGHWQLYPDGLVSEALQNECCPRL